VSHQFQGRLSNARVVAEVAQGTTWRLLLPDAAFRSGIFLLQSARAEARQASPETLRTTFHRNGLALTAYEGGLIRLSMPPTPWNGRDLDLIRHALAKAA
jgi:hypothetical protein